MKTRALIAAFALSAIVLGSGVSAFAYNGYHNYGNHAGMYAVSPENQGVYDAMMKDYYSRVSPIQDKLNAKGIELDALSRNPNAKPETISKLANEVAELRSQLRAERMTLGDKMEKELGVQPGRGMMGNGMGYTAVAIAYMAQMEPAAIVVVSFLFSILLQGSSYMQISMQIPSATGDVIQGIILLFILGSEFFSRYRVTWDRKEKEAAK